MPAICEGRYCLSEDIMHTIVTKRKDLSQDKVKELIEKKKAESGGFLSDEGAAILVAQDLGVELGGGELAKIQIKDMVSGLGNVTVGGTITEVSNLQEFKRQNGSAGKVLSFVLADETGKTRCVAWDKQAEKLEGQQIQGKSALVSHGYTREGTDGSVELHIGDRGEIEIPQELPEVEEPAPSQFVSISDALKREGTVDIVGIVKTPPRITEFKRADRSGKVLRTRLMDQTGRITLVAWNERADDLRNVTSGKAVEISGGRIKSSISGALEVHLDSTSSARILENRPAHIADFHAQPIKISQIKANMRDVDVLAKILKIMQPVAVKRANGEMTRVRHLILADDTGIIQASLWDDKAGLDLKEGEIVLIEDATSRERLGEISISVGKTGVISMNPASEIKNLELNLKRIKELPLAGSVIVEGRIVSQPSLRQVQTSKGETVDIAEIQLADDSGECRAVFWRDLAKQIAALKQGTKIRLFSIHPRLGFKGGVELSSSYMTYFETVGEPSAQINPLQMLGKISELKEEQEGIVQATILELSSTSHASPTCKKCGTRIEFKGDEGMCEKCGSNQDMDLSATLFLRIDDGSGSVYAVVESPESNTLLAQDTKWIMRNIIEKKTPRIQLTVETLSRVIGMKILAEGYLAKDPKTEGKIFRIKKLRDIRP
jgi:replication factor A1